MNNKKSFLSERLEKINVKALLRGIAIIIISFLFTWWFDKPWQKHDNVRILLITFLGTVITIALGYILWEFIAKKSFAEDIIDLVGISKTIADSGIDGFYVNFQDIDWKKVLSEASELTAAFTYARTWRESNKPYLIDYLKCGGKLIVYLPNYKSDLVINQINYFFGATDLQDSYRNKIEQSAKEFKTMGAQVKLYDGIFKNSYYLMNNKAVMAPFNHHRNKSTVPAIQTIAKGNLYSFIQDEITQIDMFSIDYEEG